jgi:hypothetical protein
VSPKRHDGNGYLILPQNLDRVKSVLRCNLKHEEEGIKVDSNFNLQTSVTHATTWTPGKCQSLAMSVAYFQRDFGVFSLQACKNEQSCIKSSHR